MARLGSAGWRGGCPLIGANRTCRAIVWLTSFREEHLIGWMHTPDDPRPGPGAPACAHLHPLKSLSIPEHVHRERFLLRQVPSVDQQRILNPIGADEDGIGDPFSS